MSVCILTNWWSVRPWACHHFLKCYVTISSTNYKLLVIRERERESVCVSELTNAHWAILYFSTWREEVVRDVVEGAPPVEDDQRASPKPREHQVNELPQKIEFTKNHLTSEKFCASLNPSLQVLEISWGAAKGLRVWLQELGETGVEISLNQSAPKIKLKRLVNLSEDFNRCLAVRTVLFFSIATFLKR